MVRSLPVQIDRILITRDQLARRAVSLGAEITRDVRRELSPVQPGAGDGWAPGNERLILVPILTGSIVFVADLIRNIPLPMSIRPVTISSYPGTATTSQGAHVQGALPTDLAGAHVLIVDDILDSGRTLGLLRRLTEAQRPASVRIAVLLRKHKAGGREEPVEVEYAGFDIEDEFVVGYGLDYDGYYRNLPDIGVLRA